ncbi:MAG: hypothetical protein IKU25_09340, partial [Clostridia bacterium]|nr:hypothetical protein [Clostridia bacterium]
DYMEKGEYEKAIAFFNLFSKDTTYKDVADKKVECAEKVSEKLYTEAVEHVNQGLSGDALGTIIKLRNIKGYKDSDEYLAKALGMAPAYAIKDDFLYIGSYELDGNTANGKEPLKWYMRHNNTDFVARNITCVSILDVLPLHVSNAFGNFTETDLFAFLNSEFYNTAFTDKEKTLLKEVKVNSVPTKVNLTNTGHDFLTLSPIAAAKNPRKNGNNICIWTSPDGSQARILIEPNTSSTAIATANDIGVVPMIYLPRSEITSARCETCGTYYKSNEECTTCTSEYYDILKSYFSHKDGGKVDQICSDEYCENYIAYSGYTEKCAGHSGHCENCYLYINFDGKCENCKKPEDSFTNIYGSYYSTCMVDGCNSYVATSGATHCCVIHSARCGNCNCFIDGDAMYCMPCLESALKKD